jgi:hypothetical protein
MQDLPRSEGARVWRAVGYAALLLLLAAWESFSRAAQGPGAEKVFSVGEELVYNVRYSFINLGQIRIQTLREVNGPDYGAYQGKALIASYSSVPFVNVRATFESTIDTSMYSRAFFSSSKDGDYLDFARYTFDYGRRKLFVEVGRGDSTVSKRETVDVPIHYQDGLSLFFFARDRLFTNQTVRIPTIIKEEKVNTTINFGGEQTEVEVDAIEYPVDVVRFEGTADFVGFFGLTGDFEGWFSNDGARVPILAHMKVILGSVTIELMEWKRAGWLPPRGGNR